MVDGRGCSRTWASAIARLPPSQSDMGLVSVSMGVERGAWHSDRNIGLGSQCCLFLSCVFLGKSLDPSGLE